MLGILSAVLFAVTGLSASLSVLSFFIATRIEHLIVCLFCALIAVVSLSGAAVTWGVVQLLRKGEAAMADIEDYFQGPEPAKKSADVPTR